jgi:hypothetical protein
MIAAKTAPQKNYVLNFVGVKKNGKVWLLGLRTTMICGTRLNDNPKSQTVKNLKENKNERTQ